MLSKFRPKLVSVLIFILFLVIKCNGSGGSGWYGEIEEVQGEEGDDDVNTNLLGGFFEVSEGVPVEEFTPHQEHRDLDKELFELIKGKIEYFFEKADFLTTMMQTTQAAGPIQNDLLMFYNVYKICTNIKHYFNKNKKTMEKELGKKTKFVKKFKEKFGDTFQEVNVGEQYNENNAIAMFNALNQHEIIDYGQFAQTEDLDKKLIELMKNKINYFSKTKNLIKVLIAQQNYESVNDKNKFVFDLIRICYGIKHYFQRERKAVKKLCEDFFEELNQMISETNGQDIFNTPEITTRYRKKDVEAMINELESHIEEKETSGENYVSPFTPATSATVVMPMGEQHQEKKKSKGIMSWFGRKKGSSSNH